MDPNLIKIRNSNLEQIKKGKFRTAFYQAKDYLSFIHGHNELAIEKELCDFRANIQQVSRING